MILTLIIAFVLSCFWSLLMACSDAGPNIHDDVEDIVLHVGAWIATFFWCFVFYAAIHFIHKFW